VPIISILDPARLAEQLGVLSDAEIDAKLRDIAESAHDRWKTEARNRLSRRTAELYADNLQILDVAPGHVSVILIGSFPNMLEQGAPSWDMRSMLRTSAKAKMGRNGYRYMVIPFRHQTPGTEGSAGAPMGSQFGDQAAAVGQRVHNEAKKLRGTLSGADAEAGIARLRLRDPEAAERHVQRLKQSTRNTLWGGIPELDTKPGVRGRLREGVSGKLRAHHATDIHAGMVRFEKTYTAAKGSHYMTFRVISENPDSMRDKRGAAVYPRGKAARARTYWVPAKVANWIHPGLQALHLVDRVVDFVEQSLIPGVFAPDGV
jgi:hypothetical protein